MNLSNAYREKLVYFSIILFGLIYLLVIAEHFDVQLISTKYVFEFATVLMLISVLGLGNMGFRNYYIVNLLVSVFVYMAILGLLQTDMNGRIFEYDFFVYLRFGLCVIIGFQGFFFPTIKKAIMVILAFGVIANIVSLFLTDTFVRSLLEDKTLTYKLQYVLLPAFFYLFQYDKLTRREKYIVILALTIYSLEQVLFQKRLPTFRVILTLLIYTYSLWLFSKDNFKVRLIIRRFILGLASFLVAFQIMALVGFNLSYYSELLVDRFYTEDTIGETIGDDSRWRIGETFYKALSSSNEFFSGRGIGSVIYDNSFKSEDETGKSYRSAAEMGLPTMLLKGGLILVSLFALIMFKLITLFRICKRNLFLFSAWVTSFIWFVFLYAEGFIGNMLSIFEIFLGFSIGVVLSAKYSKSEKIALNS